jgi:hypothetical protein
MRIEKEKERNFVVSFIDFKQSVYNNDKYRQIDIIKVTQHRS